MSEQRHQGAEPENTDADQRFKRTLRNLLTTPPKPHEQGKKRSIDKAQAKKRSRSAKREGSRK